ncbi:hypothetical protein EW146_g23 [Bondarzewia mesenterica]|uniref:Rad21/Rec8-like protein N-terminal domain-containing protein n=1 Tax=Bondarzewia mesenterica TaxID=1095465 RepID=A0A4V3XGI3_9AGAM|nr:hypothetical protein EW146_g23 [Bondarzewia mesenterica]
MFFTPELLARRDSGFGLLWLAATLGAKSTFKKLPKRDVMGADIAQLCDLIVQPAEPLALRLSSNLMVGVARVFKVKHEIFLGDVTACFTSLKKAVQDFNAMSAAAASLQMGQPTVRADAVTLTADPAMALGVNFGDLLAHWDDYMDVEEAGSDDEYGRPKRNRKKQGKRPPVSVENLRANLHTLNEDLEQVLSGSFDVSFLGSGVGGLDLSSSQIEGGFGFDGFGDNPFAVDDALDLAGGIGDELAKELGEGWGAAPVTQGKDVNVDPAFNLGSDPLGMDIDLGQDEGFTFATLDQQSVASKVQNSVLSPGKKRPIQEVDQNGSLHPLPIRSPTPHAVLSPVEPGEHEPAVDTIDIEEEHDKGQEKPGLRKAKRVRLLLDARTELTDDEMKAARAQYVEGQEALRREIEQKKFEKESGRLIDEILWGVPRGLRAPILVDYWLENFRVQVEARSGALHLEAKGVLPTKRRRIDDEEEYDQPKRRKMRDMVGMDEHGAPMDLDMNFGNMPDEDRPFDAGSHRPSSEEPGQARRVSRPPSPLGGNFDFDFRRPLNAEDELVESQRSSLFPWDNAGGPSSSANGAGFNPAMPGSDRVSVGRAEVIIRGSSTRRSSSIGPSFLGGNLGAIGFSPGPGDLGKIGSQISADHFEFDVPAEGPSLVESQQSDVNLVALERNSYNFLEYARMQSQSLPLASDGLTFDDIVPKTTSTPHVAAAAFYHCLVLATKDLIRVVQPEAYGALKIRII